MASPFERVSTPIQSQYSDPSLMESDADKSFSQTTLQQTSQKHQQQQQQLIVGGVNDVAIAQREREINDIAKGIIELSDIFRELQTMIIDQGTMLDRIDYNVERMATDVKQADTELKVVSLHFTSFPPEWNKSPNVEWNRQATTNAKRQNAKSFCCWYWLWLRWLSFLLWNRNDIVIVIVPTRSPLHLRKTLQMINKYRRG